MHIIIGIITAIAGLAWALNSLQNAGVDLNAFNPFTWRAAASGKRNSAPSRCTA